MSTDANPSTGTAEQSDLAREGQKPTGSEGLVKELRAKAWQSSSRRNSAGGLSSHKEHVCWRAAEALITAEAERDDLEAGWDFSRLQWAKLVQAEIDLRLAAEARLSAIEGGGNEGASGAESGGTASPKSDGLCKSAVIICDFMGWPEDGPAWGDALKLAGQLHESAYREGWNDREDDEEAEETYQIGLRDGYEKAVQDIDLLTGGDGAYFASTAPGEGCPDALAMKSRIAERFAAHSTDIAAAGPSDCAATGPSCQSDGSVS